MIVYLCFVCDEPEVYLDYEDTDPEGLLHSYYMCRSCGANYEVTVDEGESSDYD